MLVVQTEDELAAVAMASGAALTGARSATATSGPGFSLMAEGLGWAGINEVPLVVTLYQRGSPSTGMPTRSEQGDLQFAIHAGHGEFPSLVRKLAPAAHEIPRDEELTVYGAPHAAFTVVSWGSNKGAIREALRYLAADGMAVRLVQIRPLWPFAVAEMLPVLEQASPLVVVELNFSGQLAHLLRQQTGRESDYSAVKYNGRPMSGQELYRAFSDIHAGASEPRIVLRNPYE